MKKRHNYNFCRHQRTSQEMRANIRDEEFVRAKRRPVNLPNSWWDDFVPEYKSWKTKRINQYRADSRGEKHSLEFKDVKKMRHLVDYLKDHNIAHNTEYLRETETYMGPRRYTTFIGWVRKEITFPAKNPLTPPKVMVYWVKDYETEWVIEERTWVKVVGYRVTWWSNKDIGINYILGEKNED